jgi:chemotaxis protein CheX
MTVAAPDLSQIAADIWTAMLGLELTEAREGSLEGVETLTGCVQITGDWEGAVTVELGAGLAARAAASMFGMPPAEVTEEEVGDTVGELANVAGGNVKSTLGGTCQLSLPSVTRGRDYRVSVRGSEVVERAVLSCDGDVVVVTMLARR